MKSLPKRPTRCTGAEWLAERESRHAEYRRARAEAHERMTRELGDRATPLEQADWYLSQIADDDPLWATLARLLLSAHKNEFKPRREAER